MNETKRMLTLFGVIIVIVAIICLIAFWPEKDKTFTCKVKADKEYSKVGELTYENFDCLKDEDEYIIAVSEKITSKDKEALNTAFKNNEKGVYLVSLNNYSDSEAKTLKEKLNYSENDFEKDVLIYVKNGKVSAYKEDILDNNNGIKDFLSENGLNKFLTTVSEMENLDNLGEVDYKGFEELYNQEDPFILVLAQTTCGYCQQFEPVLSEFAKENGVVAYVINIDTFSDSEREGLTNAFSSYFETNSEWGTPLTLAVKDKNVVGDLSGYTDNKDAIKEVYTKAEIIK